MRSLQQLRDDEDEDDLSFMKRPAKMAAKAARGAVNKPLQKAGATTTYNEAVDDELDSDLEMAVPEIKLAGKL
jgi:hypothetical protein